MPRSRRVLFVTYAIASYVYRWFVTFSILFFLYQFLKPYKLGSISAMLAIGSLVPLVAMPGYQILKFVRTPGRLRKVKKVRAGLFAAAFVAVATGVLLIPTPLRVQGTLVLTEAKPAVVYSEIPGRLVDLDVRDGDIVKAGQVIALLSNPQKQRDKIELYQQHDAAFGKALWYKQASDLESRAQYMQYSKTASDLEAAVETAEEQIASLKLVAPRDGQVLGVPHPETRGQWVKPGKPFCTVADPHMLEAHLILDQSDIDLINARADHKATAWVKIYGTSETTWKSYVAEVATKNREDIPTELSNMAGGEIATKQDQKTGQVKPLTSVYEVTIPIDNSDLLLQPGLRGFAKIDGGDAPLGWWLWRLITKTFHFTL
jgi:putative peptide zinc metalloprotease protein